MSTLIAIEKLIRSGKINDARLIVREKIGRSRNRSDQLKLAEFARRVGLPNLSAKLLHRRVRGFEKANSSELCEYAISLIRLGYFKEGADLLSGPSTSALPQAILFSAFADIYKWDYISAKAKLKNYLKLDIPIYDKLVAEVNLAACFVIAGEDYTGTKLLLEDTHNRAMATSATRLAANCLELLAQLYLYNNKLAEAHRVLDLAAYLLDETGSFDGYFIKKWRNRSILDHLIFGTPYSAYRERVRQLSKAKGELSQNYIWRLNRSERPKNILDLSACPLSESSSNILRALSSDFYRPIRVSSIAEQVFPNQFFDPHSTPNRVHQIIWRLRRELVDNSIPLIIIEKNGYTLKSEGSIGILVNLEFKVDEDSLTKAKFKFAEREFTSTQLAQFMRVSKRQSQLILSSAINDGQILRKGFGRATRYQFSY